MKSIKSLLIASLITVANVIPVQAQDNPLVTLVKANNIFWAEYEQRGTVTLATCAMYLTIVNTTVSEVNPNDTFEGEKGAYHLGATKVYIDKCLEIAVEAKSRVSR